MSCPINILQWVQDYASTRKQLNTFINKVYYSVLTPPPPKKKKLKVCYYVQYIDVHTGWLV